MIVAGSVALVAGGIGLRSLTASAKPPVPLGVKDGRLAECPGTPNCVSTQAPAGDRASLQPLAWTGSALEAIDEICLLLDEMKRVTVVERSDRYVRAECRSAVFEFVDDLEFLVDEQAGVIHARSASRIGHSDFGVNRRRVARIFDELRKSQSTGP